MATTVDVACTFSCSRLFLSLILWVTLVGDIFFTRAYNLDTEVYILKEGPPNSFFGYSVAFHRIINESGRTENIKLKLESAVVEKMDNIAHRAVIRNLSIKGLSPQEIQEDIVATLKKDAPSYSMVKKWAAE